MTDPELLDLITGHARTSVADTAMRLGVLDALGDAAADTAELARRTGTHEPTLERLLRALAALGVLAEDEPGAFRLTPLGRLLTADAPAPVRAVTVVELDPAVNAAWGALDHAVRTGERAFEHVHGTDYMTRVGWFDDDGGEVRALVDRAMIDDTRTAAAALPTLVDLTPYRTVVDVGGGSGPLLAAVLAAHPHLHGTLLDRADGARLAPEVLGAAGVADRATVLAGDFFAEIPAGDVLLCKSVVFNWPDDRDVATLFANCRAAVAPHGRLLLLERMLPATVDGSMPVRHYLDDVTSVVALGGRLRTEPEYRALLTAAGFELTVHRLPGQRDDYSLLEAAPV